MAVPKLDSLGTLYDLPSASLDPRAVEIASHARRLRTHSALLRRVLQSRTDALLVVWGPEGKLVRVDGSRATSWRRALQTQIGTPFPQALRGAGELVQSAAGKTLESERTRLLVRVGRDVYDTLFFPFQNGGGFIAWPLTRLLTTLGLTHALPEVTIRIDL